MEWFGISLRWRSRRKDGSDRREETLGVLNAVLQIVVCKETYYGVAGWLGSAVLVSS
jgi:hypothetical protein